MYKKCSICLNVKDLNEFYGHPTNKDGRINRCKDCFKKYTNSRYRRLFPRADRPENIIVHPSGENRHRLSNIDLVNKTAECSVCGSTKLQYYRSSPRPRCLNSFKKPKKAANGICEICGLNTKLVYDHDHKTGKFRGWLCALCNSGIGFLKESKAILESSIKYLENSIKQR